jgi:AhpD family alkylhydroperoxidase
VFCSAARRLYGLRLFAFYLQKEPRTSKPEVLATRSLESGIPRAAARPSWVEPGVRALQLWSSFGKSTAREDAMATLGLIEYKDASPEVRAVYDDIMATRQTDWINNFWKALAHDPATLRRTWESIKQIMAEGALDRLTKELIYVAVSVTNQCNYCIASHTAGARKAGMTDAMLAELFAVVGMANETNSLASAWQVEVDEQFKAD